MKPPKHSVYLYPIEIEALKNPKGATKGTIVNLKLLGLM